MFNYGAASLEKMDDPYRKNINVQEQLFLLSGVDTYIENLPAKITDKRKIQEIFEESVQSAYQQGIIKGDKNGNVFPDMLYPFCPRHILSVYSYKKTDDRGIWFHLIDGSIWNSGGCKEPLTRPEDFVIF